MAIISPVLARHSLTLDLTDSMNFIMNSQTVGAGKGGDLSLSGDHMFDTDLTTVMNGGTILANGGTVEIHANLHQVQRGSAQIKNDGKLIIDGNADGGTIQITAGTLAFGRLTRSPAPEGASCSATVEFLGKTGAVDTGIAGIVEIFRAATNDVLLFTPNNPFGQMGTQIADLQLGGRQYSAADFHAEGSKLMFAHVNV